MLASLSEPVVRVKTEKVLLGALFEHLGYPDILLARSRF
jgi:hypothetical protein